MLHREADPEGLEHYISLMQEKNYGKRQITRLLKNSQEYRLLHAKGEVPKLVIQNHNLNGQEIREGQAFLRSKPPLFNFDLTGLCNMSPPCAMCLNWSGDIGPRHHPGLEKKDILEYGDFIRLAQDVINCGIGEPLLTKELIPILELFAAWDKMLGINSNGIALTPEFTDKLIPFFDILTITFSVDAATENTYAKIRGKHFQRMVDNIAYYCQKRLELHPGGLASKVGMVMLPMRVNRHEVVDFIRLAVNLGVDVVELRALNEIQEDVQVQKGDFLFDYKEQMLSLEELEEVRIEAEKAAFEMGIILDCQYKVSEEETYYIFLPIEFQDMDIKCTQPWRFLLPYQNGDTVGCCYMNESLGNWREKGLDVLWNSQRMQNMRKEMATGTLSSECWDYSSCPIVKAEKAKTKGKGKDMEKEEILTKITEIKKSISEDNIKIIHKKILEREFHVFKPNRLRLIGKPIQTIRKRLAAEVEHVIQPILDSQKEINLRLLKEIEELKKLVQSDQQISKKNEKESQASAIQDQD
jgi:MoaA/NifB/PqqE/SkfB family radical SAM enzyme